MSREDDLERIARIVVDCGYGIHRDLGPGLLESAYEALLSAALSYAGLAVRRQVPVTMNYRGVVVDNAFRIDLLVEEMLVVEIKSVERFASVHAKQLLTYLRLMSLPLGLLMNCGQATFKDGLQRVANDYYGHIGKN
jgi:GxxExxY protein